MIRSVKERQRLYAKLEWAEKHIHNLHATWTEFREKGYRVESKDDPDTRKRIYYLADAWDLDDDIPMVIGDAVHGLRSALDHLAYRAMRVSPGVITKDSRNVSFPIASDSTKYQSIKSRRVKGMRTDVVKAIDEIEPYGGGQGDLLWYLHKLDIIDKHRVLIAVGSTRRQQSVSPSEIARLKQKFLGIHEDIYTPAQEALLFQTARADVQFPLKRGDILAIVPESEVNEHMQFTFEVAFGEPVALRGEPVIAILFSMSSRIRNIIREFDTNGYLE